MSEQVEWRPKLSSELVVRYADFADELAVGEVLSSAITTTTVWSGNDPTPNVRVISTAVMANFAGVNSLAAVTFSGGIQGTIYQCVIQASTSQSRTIDKVASLAIKPALD